MVKKTETKEEPESLDAHTFLKTNPRQHKVRPNSTKRIRLLSEVDFVNAFTEEYIKGEITKENIKILADIKAFLKQLPGNPYKLKDNEANAMIQTDLKTLCINGIIKDNTTIKLQAKELSTNRVTYFNPILAQEIINAEENEETKTQMQERFGVLKDLPNRRGYGGSTEST